MKNILLFVFIISSLSISAQDLVVTPNPIVEWEVEADIELLGDARIQNTSTETKTYIWERTVMCSSGGIETWLCDPAFCYVPFVDSEQFTLGPGEEGPFQLHATFEDGADRGLTVQIKVTEVDNPANVLDVMYELNACSDLVSVEDELQFKEIKLFPNPANDHFSLTNTSGIKDVIIHNIIGAPVKQYIAEENATYSMSDLPSGIYTVQLINDEGSNIGSKRVIKQ